VVNKKEKKMKWCSAAVVVVGVVAVGAGTVMGMHHEVKIQEKEGLGTYLTDAEGKTLYWFKKDSSGQSACVGSCLEKWPVYYQETVAAQETLKAEDFGTITREDGAMQTTFRGYPLYYWAGDTQPGETNGQGVNDVWFVINPDNFPSK
jgi:predicted lipoprotein with Yx(FWY)xxD motif